MLKLVQHDILSRLAPLRTLRKRCIFSAYNDHRDFFKFPMNDNRIEQTIKPYHTPMFRDDAPSFLWDILVVLLSKHKKNYVESMLCDIAIIL